MTLEERCKLAADCLPQAEYRRRLEALHAELLAAVAAERERCALLCEAEAIYRYSREESPWPGDAPTTQGHKAVTAAKLAAAIRAQP
jgi:hypothetical protein